MNARPCGHAPAAAPDRCSLAVLAARVALAAARRLMTTRPCYAATAQSCGFSAGSPLAAADGSGRGRARACVAVPFSTTRTRTLSSPCATATSKELHAVLAPGALSLVRRLSSARPCAPRVRRAPLTQLWKRGVAEHEGCIVTVAWRCVVVQRAETVTWRGGRGVSSGWSVGVACRCVVGR